MVVRNTDEKHSINSSHEPMIPVTGVSTEVIVRRIFPLVALSEAEIRHLVECFDEEKVGSLTEQQWIRFCEENQKRFASLGLQRTDLDRCGEFTVTTLPNEPSQTHTHRFAQGVVRFLEGFTAGGIAGAVSKTVIAPADRVKIIFQVDSTRRFSLLNAFLLGVRTVKEEGILGLWIGNGAMMMRVVPYAAITFVSFDFYQSLILGVVSITREDGTEEELVAVPMRFISGSLAGATATACTYPLDLMRARFAAHSGERKRLPSYRMAFRSLVTLHGFRSLYSGLLPTLVGIAPYAGCSFAVFETSKSYIVQWKGLTSDKEIAVRERMLAGGFAGLVAQSATYPLDIVRRRMQVSPGRYRGVLHALQIIYREEGLRQGLYKGLSMNWIKGPIAVSISFTINDILKRRMRDYDEKAGMCSHRKNLVTIPEAFVCGGVAAGVAKMWTVPFDRLKIMYQVGMNGTEPLAFGRQGVALMYAMATKSPGIWKGSGITMGRVIPYGALTYCFFDIFQTISERILYSPNPTPATNFLAGGSAAALATAIVYPLDLVRAKAATNTLPFQSQSYYWLLRSMAKYKGIRSLWKGCPLAIMGVCPLAGSGFATYEWIKERYQCGSFGERLLGGMVAGVAGQVATYPLNVAKRRRQVERSVYSGFGDLRKIFMLPGFYASLYRKMPGWWLVGSMTFGVSFAVNDLCRDWMVKAKKEILHDLFFY